MHRNRPVVAGIRKKQAATFFFSWFMWLFQKNYLTCTLKQTMAFTHHLQVLPSAASAQSLPGVPKMYNQAQC